MAINIAKAPTGAPKPFSQKTHTETPKFSAPQPTGPASNKPKMSPPSFKGFNKKTTPKSSDETPEEKAAEKLSQAKKKIEEIQKKSKAELKNISKEEMSNQVIDEILETSQKQEVVKTSIEEAPKEKEEVLETLEIPTDETQKDEKSKTKRKAKAQKEENIKPQPVEQYETYKDYVGIAQALSTFNDPSWETHKEELSKRLGAILIESDMNTATLMAAVQELGELRSLIWIPFSHYKTEYQNLNSDKPEGLLERTKRKNATGSNDDERRRNGIYACENFVQEANGKKVYINLYEYLEETRSRYNFYKDLIDMIDYKSRSLITMNSALLMEQRALGPVE